jgi:C-terminal processing protease CtpA/Prc
MSFNYLSSKETKEFQTKAQSSLDLIGVKYNMYDYIHTRKL